MLLDIGVHMLDQLAWIFGDPVVTRAFDDSFEGGVETNSLLSLTFPRGRGIMQVSWEYPLNNGLRIRGSSGEVILDNADIRTYRRKTPKDGRWYRPRHRGPRTLRQRAANGPGPQVTARALRPS
ncbi:Gfo/Idh/MocA family protein [Mycolicibacterium psychrotolerans]|uniref:Gfo/Idh/MocA family protein n=1 Tax=Mycolicibacterium psychrotolerans TaxID=216929 RepID=UPI003D670902